MWKALILVCASSVDHAHCQQGLAIDSLEAFRTPSMQQCAFEAQTMMAQTAIGPRGSEYMMITCRPERLAARQ